MHHFMAQLSLYSNITAKAMMIILIILIVILSIVITVIILICKSNINVHYKILINVKRSYCELDVNNSLTIFAHHTKLSHIHLHTIKMFTTT